jgi:hypothetical protein
LKLPVSLASNIRDPLARILDSWYVIVATGLDQQNADVGIFGQTTRNYRTRRAPFAPQPIRGAARREQARAGSPQPIVPFSLFSLRHPY